MKQPKGPERLLRPWGLGWQIWERAESAWILSGAIENLDAAATTEISTMVLPARKVACFSLWIEALDEAVIRDSALLQLEVLGCVQAGAPSESVSVERVGGDADRSLARAAVYPPDYALPTGFEPAHFAASPLCMDLPPDAICCWREPDGLTVAVTGAGGKVICWEFMSPRADESRMRMAVERFVIELQGDRVIAGSPRVIDWSGALGGAMVAGQFVDSRADADAPPPKLPAELPRWAPPNVLEAKAGRARAALVKRVAIGLGVVVAILAAAVAGVLAWSSQRNSALEAEIARLSIEADPLIQSAKEWQMLSPSVEVDEFALEQLLIAVSSLPADGVRLSLFEMTPAGIRIEGDARNVGLATLYFNTLRTAEGADGFEWAMAPPSLQPDNSAKFAIEGSPIL